MRGMATLATGLARQLMVLRKAAFVVGDGAAAFARDFALLVAIHRGKAPGGGACSCRCHGRLLNVVDVRE